MSFIKKDKDKGNSIWDWIILGVILVGSAGFYFYQKNIKSKAADGFAVADSLFQVKEYKLSLEAYNKLRASDYLEPVHDSILSQRLDTLYTLLGIEYVD